ncbi:MAG: tRNA (adenosine(37)-N6)-threonylcarbamoyltransferase complex dimerization subunit type 1 TsaB [Gemmatimonadaceae bacterium]
MLGNVLILETSTEAGSVAIAREGALVAEIAFASRLATTGARTEALAPAVVACLSNAGISTRDLSAVVCGAGPGGFTSLRAAAALGKGICSALGLPLFGVSSLELLGLSADVPEGPFIVAAHAGRNEWFAADAARTSDGGTTVDAWFLVGDDDLRAHAVRSGARLVGPGLDCDIAPCAGAVIAALTRIEARGPVDLDAWEPAYGRLAEAQVKWEAAHGRPLTA